jgi:hypothetical protein
VGGEGNAQQHVNGQAAGDDACHNALSPLQESQEPAGSVSLSDDGKLSLPPQALRWYHRAAEVVIHRNSVRRSFQVKSKGPLEDRPSIADDGIASATEAPTKETYKASTQLRTEVT